MKNLPTIVIKSIPHRQQRYNTCGDYFKGKHGDMNLRISRMNANHEFLVMIHELIEWFLTAKRGVTIEQIDAFDMAYEQNRKQGNTEEPGDDLKAPYYHEHQIATKIERELAEYLGVDWEKYDEHVNSL